MSAKRVVVAFSLACIAWGSASRAFAQAPAAAPPGAPPPPYPGQYPQYPPGQYPPAQYPPYQPVQPLYNTPPPPASAIAPNGEYVAPMSQTTQPTYVPQSVAMSGPRMIKDWQEGQPIPYGYHPEERVRKGLVIGGSITFGAVYLYNLLIAALGEDISSAEGGGGNKVAWLYLPVLGPFLETTETSSATLHLLLVMDGLAQAAGAWMLIYGVMYPKKVLVRNDLASTIVVPMRIGMDGSGLGLVGRF